MKHRATNHQILQLHKNKTVKERLKALLLALAAPALLSQIAACSRPHDMARAEVKQAKGPAIIPIEEGTVKQIGLRTEKITIKNLAYQLHLTGQIEADIGRQTDVSSRVAGCLTKILVKPGQTVKKGCVIAVIDSRKISEMQAEVLEAKSRLAIARGQANRELLIYKEQVKRPKALLNAKALLANSTIQTNLAEANYKRQAALYREKISSAKDYLQAKANLEIAKVASRQAKVAFEREERLYQEKSLLKRDYQLAEAEAARAKQHLGTLIKRLEFLGAEKKMIDKLLTAGEIDGTVNVVAPIDGILNHYDCAIGEVIAAQAVLFRITDLSSVQVVTELPEIYSSLVKLGNTVKVTTTGYPKQPTFGLVSFIGLNVNPTSRTLSIRAKLPNKQGHFRENMYADIEIEGKPSFRLACPKSALQDYNGEKIVFVKKKSGFEARPVKLGIDSELYSEVLTGLAEGDEVATQGSLMLKAELGYRR